MSAAPAIPIRIACDAMCGGLARWLRLLGVDASYTPGIDDGILVEQAQAEGRILISSDGRLFDRNPLKRGVVRGLRLPVGLGLEAQVRWVVRELEIRPGIPRCTHCNGELEAVPRAAIAERVPARTLIWVREFYRCRACEHVFWEGTHWGRIGRMFDSLLPGDSRPATTNAVAPSPDRPV